LRGRWVFPPSGGEKGCNCVEGKTPSKEKRALKGGTGGKKQKKRGVLGRFYGKMKRETVSLAGGEEWKLQKGLWNKKEKKETSREENFTAVRREKKAGVGRNSSKRTVKGNPGAERDAWLR